MSAYPSVAEVEEHFADYLERVARGERFVLTQAGNPVAELAPVPKSVKLHELPSLLEALAHLSPEEAAAFESDLDQARAELDKGPQTDPWES